MDGQRPPTPAEVLDELVDRFAPADDLSSLTGPKQHARRRLAVQMIAHAYGESHPLSRLVEEYNLIERSPDDYSEINCERFGRMARAWCDILSSHEYLDGL